MSNTMLLLLIASIGLLTFLLWPRKIRSVRSEKEMLKLFKQNRWFIDEELILNMNTTSTVLHKLATRNMKYAAPAEKTYSTGRNLLSILLHPNTAPETVVGILISEPIFKDDLEDLTVRSKVNEWMKSLTAEEHIEDLPSEYVYRVLTNMKEAKQLIFERLDEKHP